MSVLDRARSGYEFHVEADPDGDILLRILGLFAVQGATLADVRHTQTEAAAWSVLEVTGLAPLLQARVDGVTIRERGMPGKPAPDTFLEGARLLGVEPARAAVFEDALAGVQAGATGGFGYVIGVDRVGQGRQLHESGADRVVADLAELLDDAAAA